MPLLIELDEVDIAFLEEAVGDPQSWIESILHTKIVACRDRIVKAAIRDAFRNQEIGVPANKDSLVERFLGAPGYKNRKQQDLEPPTYSKNIISTG